MLKCLPVRNFTGRTSYLKAWLDLDAKEHGRYVYLGEMPSNYISGLAPTVQDEVTLHNLFPQSDTATTILSLLRKVGLDKKFTSNPFDLSGGEQSLLIILCNLLINSDKLAIDATFEQLNRKWRTPLFDLISNTEYDLPNMLISDNRLGEYNVRWSQQEFTNSWDGLNTTFRDIIFSAGNIGWIEARALSLSKVSFGYQRNNLVIKNCSYDFEPGMIYHLNGENGSGKSTLSKLLCGLYKPYSGSFAIGGRVVDLYQYPGKFLGYCFQNPDDQLFRSSVKKELYQTGQGKESNQTNIVDYVVKLFGLEKLMDMHPGDLPFVMRKRVSLAATLCNEREWYIFDEPTIGQDDINTMAICDIIKYLAKQGKGIILITHSEYFINYFDNAIQITLANGTF